MPRIAILTPYAHPTIGGISSFVGGLARLLRENNHEVTTIAGEGDGDVTNHSNLGLGREFIQRARTILAETKPDVIHCNAHWYTLAAGVSYLRSNPSARLVFSFHTTGVPKRGSALRRLLRKAHVLTFVSASQLATLRGALRIGVDSRLLRPAVFMDGVDQRAASHWASQAGLAGAFPILVFTGPLEYAGKVDGVLDLIRSVPKLQVAYPEIRLLIVGGGELEGRVRAETAGLEKCVTMTGSMRDPKLAMANADIYSHISYQESFGIAVLEAMSLSRCVLASDVGGIPEIVDGTNGLLVGRGPGLISQAIQTLASDPDLRSRLGAAARSTVDAWHTWEQRLPELNSIYGMGE